MSRLSGVKGGFVTAGTTLLCAAGGSGAGYVGGYISKIYFGAKGAYHGVWESSGLPVISQINWLYESFYNGLASLPLPEIGIFAGAVGGGVLGYWYGKH